MAKETSHYDVIVIGAGLFGVSTADALAARGKHVLVLDKGIMGNGASKGNARMSKKDPRAPIFNRLVGESQRIILTDLENKGAILTPVPCFDVFEPTHPSRTIYRGLLQEEAEKNPHVVFGVTPEQEKALYVYAEETYVINPHALLLALRERCTTRGCTFKEDSAVIQWNVKDQVVSVSTEIGMIYTTNQLVIAAHGWSRALLEKGNIPPHSSFSESTYTKRAPIWQFEFPEGVCPAIGRSSLPGKAYLDVYYLPESSEASGKPVMKVGLNSDKDRTTQYQSPDDIYLDPAISQITDTETAEVKRLMQERFGISLGEPLSKEVCCMTYSTVTQQEQFSHPIVGPFIAADGTKVFQVVGIFAGCGIGAKLCPALGNIVARGIETGWKGEKSEEEVIFSALSPNRFMEESEELVKPTSAILLGKTDKVFSELVHECPGLVY